ncbi:MAG: DUF2812 domain-containing protein [Chloroflexi bacterium]|nr:DUF2812 domain-containing protein [Chloroflexota bacterium]
MTTLKQFHWFWAWDDEKEEGWLRDMARKGWHFTSVTFPGYYHFEQGEPKDYVFRLDFLPQRKDISSYLQLFEDTGWDYMGEMNSWQYFRKEAVNGEAPEIFTDGESKSKKYQRILLILVVFMPIFVINLKTLNTVSGRFFEVVTFITFLIYLLCIYSIIRLGARIIKLKKKL